MTGQTEAGLFYLPHCFLSWIQSIQQLFIKPSLLPWAVHTGEEGTVPALSRHSSELGNGMYNNKISK